MASGGRSRDSTAAKGRRKASSLYKALSPLAKGQKIMSEKDYLGSKGVGAPMSDYNLDKVRIPHGETRRQMEKRIADGVKAMAEHEAKRKAATAEYNELLRKGAVRAPTRVETLYREAHGHADLKSTSAARRALEKRGYDWRTGKKVK